MRAQIAARLEKVFSEQGFAEPSVEQIKNACEVSLRTLYKYYPSKQEMIAAALVHRHQRYFNYLLDGAPEAGSDAIMHIFDRLAQWMNDYAANGCMSLNALAAFPEQTVIITVVKEYKLQVREFLSKQSLREDLANELFLLHEGVASAWPVLGDDAVNAAQRTLLILLQENNHA